MRNGRPAARAVAGANAPGASRNAANAAQNFLLDTCPPSGDAGQSRISFRSKKRYQGVTHRFSKENRTVTQSANAVFYILRINLLHFCTRISEQPTGRPLPSLHHTQQPSNEGDIHEKSDPFTGGGNNVPTARPAPGNPQGAPDHRPGGGRLGRQHPGQGPCDLAIYGVGHLSADSIDNGTGSSSYLHSNSSRLGFKGGRACPSPPVPPGAFLFAPKPAGKKITER